MFCIYFFSEKEKVEVFGKVGSQRLAMGTIRQGFWFYYANKLKSRHVMELSSV